MSSFTDKLVLNNICDGIWETSRDFCFYITDPCKDTICVPKGFQTDGASVPKAFQSIFPKDGPYIQAAVLHDWLYEKSGFTNHKTYTRKEIDKIFYESMRVIGIPFIARNVLYMAVRLYSHLYGDNFKPNYYQKGTIIKIVDKYFPEFYGKDGVLIETTKIGDYMQIYCETSIINCNYLGACRKICHKN
jgi:hypothetical protein